MKIIILYLILLHTGLCYSQIKASEIPNSNIDTSNLKLVISDTFIFKSFVLPPSPFTIKNAIRNINIDSLKVVIHSGFMPISAILDSTKSVDFQKKYNVQFEFLGCISFWDPSEEDTVGYNDIIFEYLTKKHGVAVRSEFDAIWK